MNANNVGQQQQTQQSTQQQPWTSQSVLPPSSPALPSSSTNVANLYSASLYNAYNSAIYGYGVEYPTGAVSGAGGIVDVTGGSKQDDARDESSDIGKCHLHTKPLLTCKFCRKYKRAAHHQARIAQQQAHHQTEEEKKGMVEMTNQVTFNVNNLLRENILSSEYFKSLYALKSFNEVVDEIYQYVDHAEPYCAGHNRAPSTLFCCLFKMFTLKLSERQVSTLLNHPDSPFIRCVGFLYLRYVHPFDKLWNWYSPYVLDDEEFAPGVDKLRIITVGEYVEGLLSDDKYYATVLPRLPAKIKSLYGAQLMAMSDHRKRKQQNMLSIDEFVTGAKVAACSNDDWLDGEIVRQIETASGQIAFVVQLEDGTDEEIDLGLLILQQSDDCVEVIPDTTAQLTHSAPNGQVDELPRRRQKRRSTSSTRRPKSISRTKGNTDRSYSDTTYRRKHEDYRRESHRYDDDKHRYDDDKHRYDDDKHRYRHGRHSDSSLSHQRRETRSRRDKSSDSEKYSRRTKKRGEDDDDGVCSRRYDTGNSRCDRRSRSRERSVSSIDSQDGRRRRRGGEYGGEGQHAGKTSEELLLEFKRREASKALATGKDYARRPTSYKSCLSRYAVSGVARKRFTGSDALPPVTATTATKSSSSRPHRDRSASPEEFQKRHKIAQLMEKYTSQGTAKMSSARPTNHRDVEGPDVLRLG